MLNVDAASFLTVVVVAALASLLASLLARRLVVPVVVFELTLGIVVGPELLGIAHADRFVDFFSSLGLGMLFFFAGYEIDFERIRGAPLRLAVVGWLISLALAYALGGLLALAGIVLSLVFVGSAMATTAIGTLIPILQDADELKSDFGTYLLAAGAIGEFGPILLITLAAGRLRRRHHPARRAARARSRGARIEADGARLRLPDPLLLRRLGHEGRPGGADRRPGSRSSRCDCAGSGAGSSRRSDSPCLDM